MSNVTIGKGLPPPAKVGPAEPLHRNRERQSAGYVRRESGRSLDDDDGSHGLSPGMHDRRSAFEQHLERGLKQHEGNADEQRQEDDSRELIVALAAPGATPLAGTEVAPSEALPNLSEAIVQKVIAVSLQIERALAVQGLPRWDAPLTVRLNVEGIADGLVGLTINSGPGMLDIVLERTVEGITPELAAAAQLLADRLQQRFPNRAIRVLDRLTDRQRAVSSAAAVGHEQAEDAAFDRDGPS
jgi:hypothetical protein